MFITEVNAIVNADAKFPEFDENEWELTNKQSFKKDKDNEYDYSFLHYKRKQSKTAEKFASFLLIT